MVRMGMGTYDKDHQPDTLILRYEFKIRTVGRILCNVLKNTMDVPELPHKTLDVEGTCLRFVL